LRIVERFHDLLSFIVGEWRRRKEGLSFTGEDSALSKLLLSVMGAFAEFERSLILERQREGIAIAKRAGKYTGRRPILTDERATELRKRIAGGEPKAALAREYKISRETLYQYARNDHSRFPAT
jgi:DNA invertase Pin-like site-specific DNA recombinase